VLASAGRYHGLNIGFADVSLRRNFVLASPKLRFGFAETSFWLRRNFVLASPKLRFGFAETSFSLPRLST
jgi:hypothetical protein